MDALITASSSLDASHDLARPIAGAPLLARQLEYLRANGITRVVINRVADETAQPSLRSAALNVGVAIAWIPSTHPLGRVELALRAGLADVPVVVLAHGRLSSVDLGVATALARQTGDDIVIGDEPGAIEIWHAGKTSRGRQNIAANGWIVDVLDEATAQSFTEDVLLGRRAGVEVRGSEITPGVWAARGSTVSRGAHVEAPCYFGPNSFVAAGARVGPGAVLGDGAIVESGARIVHARIADGAVVGQGLDVARTYVATGMLIPHGGEAIVLDDELLVGGRRSSTIPSRLAAAAALGVVAPAAIAFGGGALAVARRLARVVAGKGTWVGVRGDDPDSVVLDVEDMLLPPDAQEEDRSAARAFYRSTKSASSDARLIFASLTRAEDRR